MYNSEYALRLAAADNSEFFLTKTNPKSRYTHIVAESDYLEDFKEGWEYTLRHFIEQYKEALQQHPKEEYLSRDTPKSSSFSERKLKRKNSVNLRNHYPIKLISYLKCHYCNLDFHDVEARREHELEWHV